LSPVETLEPKGARFPEIDKLRSIEGGGLRIVRRAAAVRVASEAEVSTA